MLRLWNTLTRREEEFAPQRPPEVLLYTCGPTVYDRVHIGNLRAFLFYDVLRRSLDFVGLRPKHVMNITDVDDKTIRRSREQKMSLRAFTEKYTDVFLQDLDALRVKRPDVLPRATDAVPEMVALVQRLQEKNVAYKAPDGSIYFRIDAFPEYGKLAHLDRSGLQAGAGGRVAADEYDKESVRDFALWKAWDAADGDVFWETPLGKGRPGWHLECSALAMRHLAESIDIHAGGVDLVFPHHENEIAQTEAATGRTFARLWAHNEHLLVAGQKMSKSLKNFYTLEDLKTIAKATPREVRYALISVHYRQRLNFQVTYDEQGKPVRFDSIEQARGALERIDAFRRSLDEPKGGPVTAAAREALATARRDFAAGIEADLNISLALAALHGLIGALNKESFDKPFAAEVKAALAEFDRVLGVIEPEVAAGLSPEEAALIQEREDARKRKDWKRSDELRAVLKARGIEVEDKPGGQQWRRRAT
jgi:cysteinyl-tRNA synthetase